MSPEFIAMEAVLRDGFRNLIEWDEGKARDYFLKGAKVRAFDANQVVEVFLRDLSEINHDKIQVCLGCNHPFGVIPFGSRGQFSLFDPGNSFVSGLDSDVWSEDIGDRLVAADSEGDQKSVFPGDLNFLFARARALEALKVVRSGKIDRETKGLFVIFLGMADANNYGLLTELPDIDKVRMVSSWLEGSQIVDFGPITGRADPGALDLEKLRAVVRETEMKNDVRDDLDVMLEGWPE